MKQNTNIYWSAHNNSSFLAGHRQAKSIRSAVIAARRYVQGELYGEGIVTIYVDDYPCRVDECSIFTGYKWVSKTK